MSLDKLRRRLAVLRPRAASDDRTYAQTSWEMRAELARLVGLDPHDELPADLLEQLEAEAAHRGLCR